MGKQARASISGPRFIGQIGLRPAPAQQRKRLIVGNPEQPPGKAGRIVKFRQVLISLQKRFLADIQRIFAMADQPQQVVEDTLLPPGHEKVIGLHISPSRLGDQVAIFDFAKDQRLLRLRRRTAGRKSRIRLETSL
jgi:hypothetical protein